MLIDLPRSFGARRHKRARRRSAAKLRSDDPVQDLRDAASELGYAGDWDDLSAMADWLWDAEPSDGMADLLDELIAMGVIASPY